MRRSGGECVRHVTQKAARHWLASYHVTEGHDPEDGLTGGLDTGRREHGEHILEQLQTLQGAGGVISTCKEHIQNSEHYSTKGHSPPQWNCHTHSPRWI